MSHKPQRTHLPSFSIADLDAVVGGVALQTPAGGAIRESSSNYKWWGMTYQQTTREAVDEGGNVVGTEVNRPGSAWSDSTTNTGEGSSTTYSTGTSVGNSQTGAGFNASLTSNHDAQGSFTGVNAHADGEAHANGTALGDLSARGNADGNASEDARGNLELDGKAQGSVSAVDPETGYGVELRGEANGHGSLDEKGLAWKADASATGAITQHGEDVAALRLGEVGTSGHIGADENGDWSASGTLRGGALGQRVTVDGSGTYRADGTLEGSATANYSAGIEGRYNAGFEGSAGVNGTLRPDGSFDAGATANGNGHAQLGDVRLNGEANLGGTAHFGDDGTYQGADVTGGARGEVSGPGYSGSLSGNGTAHFDQENKFTGAEYEERAGASLGGEQVLDYSTSGTYTPQNNGAEQTPTDELNRAPSNDYPSSDYTSSNQQSGPSNEYSTNDSSQNTSYSSNDYGSNTASEYTSNDPSPGNDASSETGTSDSAYA